MTALQTVLVIAFGLGLIFMLHRLGRGANEIRKQARRHHRFEPSWTETYAAGSGLTYGHQVLGSEACPTREELADIAWTGYDDLCGGPDRAE